MKPSLRSTTLALLLSLCMLVAAMPAALSEEIDIEVVDANSTDIDVDLPEFRSIH